MMSNPALLFLSGNNTLAGEDTTGAILAVATGALRYRSGALPSTQAFFIEEGTTNLITNPSFEVSTSPWSPGNATIAVSTEQAQFGTSSCKHTITDVSATPDLALFGSANRIPVNPSQPYTLSAHVFGTATRQYTPQVQWYDSGLLPIGAAIIGTAITATGEVWEELVPLTETSPANAATAEIRLRVELTGSLVGDIAYFDGIQFEQKAFASTYADGSLGTGYAWTGTAHASTSTRSETQVTPPLPTAFSPERGSLAVYLRRDVDSNNSQFGLVFGQRVAGVDWLGVRAAVTNNDRPRAQWKSGTQADLATTWPTAITPGTWFLFYIEWVGTAVRIGVDDQPLVTGTRDAVQGTWSATTFDVGSFGLSQQVNGRVGPLLLIDRLLSDAERTGLVEATAWRFDMLADVTDLATTWASDPRPTVTWE